MPLLFCSCLVSASLNPGDFVAEGAAKVNGGFIHGELVDHCPEFQLISVTLALVAVISSAVQVHRKRSTAAGRRTVDRARSVQLVSGSTRWLEAKLVQYLFHPDLSAEHVEVDTRHDHLLGFLHPLSVQREDCHGELLGPV